MTSHIHFPTDSHLQIINAAVSSVVSQCCSPEAIEVRKKRIINVYGIEKISQVEVIDRVITVAQRSIYHQALGEDQSQSHSLDCTQCMRYLNQKLANSTLEIALRIMEALRLRGIATSCEGVAVNAEETMTAFLRKNAVLAEGVSSVVTQQVAMPPSIFLGPFEELCEVQQREYAITTPQSEKPVLATWHLADCFAFFGYDREQRLGFLFHIDRDSNLWTSFNRFKQHLYDQGYRNVNFECYLMGGVDDSTGICSRSNMEDRIMSAIKRSCDDQCRFVVHSMPNVAPLLFEDVVLDSGWSQAVRLCRSVAIDFRDEDPLSNLQGYEPQLNPFSVDHSRQHSIEETERFIHSTSRIMKLVQKAPSKSAV